MKTFVFFFLSITGCNSASSLNLQLKADRFFTVIVLPDTQNYTDSSHGGRPEFFYDQTKWIEANMQKLNIKFVIHVGDIVNHRSEEEWAVADEAMSIIEDDVPYILAQGSHESPGDFNRVFGPSRFMENPIFDSAFCHDKSAHFYREGKIQEYYLYFSALGMDFMVISLRFRPPEDVIQWAAQVVEAHPERRVIIDTHSYIHPDGTIVEEEAYSYRRIWDGLISRYDNIFLVVCGHRVGESLLTSTRENGTQVHQLLSNYQLLYGAHSYEGEQCGGCGHLRIMTFYPDYNLIKVVTYSPSFDSYLEIGRLGGKSRFDLDYSMFGKIRRGPVGQ